MSAFRRRRVTTFWRPVMAIWRRWVLSPRWWAPMPVSRRRRPFVVWRRAVMVVVPFVFMRGRAMIRRRRWTVVFIFALTVIELFGNFLELFGNFLELFEVFLELEDRHFFGSWHGDVESRYQLNRLRLEITPK
jgi:hypothetical protein